MNAAIVAGIALLALPFACVIAGTSRARPPIALASAAGLLLAMVALEVPELRSSSGFLVEPIRGWALHAVLLGVGAAALLRTLRGWRWGLVAAGAALVLLSGHAAVAIGALIALDAALATKALDARPRTLHAANPVRLAAGLLLASDIVLAAGFLLVDAPAMEPIGVDAAGFVIAACALRVLGLLRLDGDTPPLAPLLLGLPMLVPLGWIGGADAEAGAVVFAIGAAAAAVRWWRGSRPQATNALVLLVLLLATSGPAALLSVPSLLACAVGIAILPDLVRGSAVLVTAVAGGSMLAVAEAVLATTSRTGADGRLVGAAITIALALLVLGALGPVEGVGGAEQQPTRRAPLVIVLGGLLALVAFAPTAVARVVQPAILAARAPDGVAEAAIRQPAPWIPFATAAVLLAWAVCTRLLPARGGVGTTREPELVPSVAAEPVERSARILAAFAVAAGLFALAILVRSATQGWL